MVLDLYDAKLRNSYMQEKKDPSTPVVWKVLVHLSEVSYGILAYTNPFQLLKKCLFLFIETA